MTDDPETTGTRMHQFPTMDPYFGFSPASVIAGFLCGLACFVVGLIKNHVGAGVRCFGVCVFLGAFVSYWAAIPAAIVLSAMLWFEDYLAAYVPRLPAWMTWTPLLPFQASSSPVSPTVSNNEQGSAVAEPEMRHCGACGKGFVLANGTLPPWCPQCGADIEKQVSATP